MKELGVTLEKKNILIKSRTYKKILKRIKRKNTLYKVKIFHEWKISQITSVTSIAGTSHQGSNFQRIKKNSEYFPLSGIARKRNSIVDQSEFQIVSIHQSSLDEHTTVRDLFALKASETAMNDFQFNILIVSNQLEYCKNLPIF